ncbi:hypothetical protein CEXT_419691 [Caerostris extrusa]|uniref:Uncharacterized protein n=1 Tax=Caerostris extrusa TaxID=172846 RepID=A0AAV4W6Z1_CAEEX|nr:hypothetical protein CEXT_419691 [Caerostris extrusa]
MRKPDYHVDAVNLKTNDFTKENDSLEGQSHECMNHCRVILFTVSCIAAPNGMGCSKTMWHPVFESSHIK